MRKLSKYELLLVGRVHTLMCALSKPGIECVWPGRRSVDRLWLDGVDKRTLPSALRAAIRMGLVRERFENPYVVGHGESFVGLSYLGAAVAKCLHAQLKRKS